MKIAIMSAMTEELVPLLNKLKNYEVQEYANNKYYLAKHNNHEIVLAYSKIGKVNSALTASILIEKFGAQTLLFSGVAGGLNDTLQIGDLVVATSLLQHDIDITAFGHPFGYVPESKVFVHADKKLIDTALKIAKDKDLKLKQGIVATGDQFVCQKSKKDWIKNTFHADIVEMEGGAVAFVCDSLNIPFFVLRAISDTANEKADFDFDEFLVSSSKISANFIIYMLENIDG